MIRKGGITELRLKRFTFYVVLVTVLLASVVTFAQRRSLTVWVLHEQRHREYEYVINLFREEHPDISVNLQLLAGSQAEFMDQLFIATLAGTPPDLTWVEGSAVIEFAARGLFRDVTDVLADYRFTPADAQEMTFHGRMYGAPYHTTSRGLFKRLDIFEQAGLDPHADPASLDELEQWSTRLTVRHDDGYSRIGFVPWGSNWGAPAWMWAFGGELVVEEAGQIRPTATHPRNVDAFEWIRSYAARYGNVFSPVTIGAQGFIRGTVAMDVNSTSNVGTYLKDGIPFTTGRVPHPPEGRNGTWGGGQAIAIPFNAQNVSDAERLLQFFSDPQVQQKRFEAFPEALPANWDALAEIVPTLAPEYAALIDQLPEARPRTPLWLEYYTLLLRPAERSVVEGIATPLEVLDGVQRAMDDRYREHFGGR